MERCVSRLCLHEEKCRVGTEGSVKITCDAEENKLFENVAIVERRLEWRRRMEETERRDHGGHDRVLTISGRRTHYG